MASGTTKPTARGSSGAAKKNISPISGARPKTAHGSGMSVGTTSFAAHLRSRCEEIGLQALAEALDRLEAPWEEDVTEHTARPVEQVSRPAADLCRKEAA